MASSGDDVATIVHSTRLPVSAFTRHSTYTIPLHAATAFSKIDVVQTQREIIVVTEGVEEAAVTAPFGLFEFLLMSIGFRSAQIIQKFIDSIT